MNIIQLGSGVVPVPPGDEPDGIEDYIYRITHLLASGSHNVTVIDIKAGEFQQQKRKESSAKFHELWQLPLPHRYNHPFLQKIIDFFLLMIHTWVFSAFSAGSIFKLLGKQKVDIINTHISDPTLSAIVVNKVSRSQAKVVYATHTPIVMSRSLWRKYFLNLNETLALKLADHVIVDTPAVKRQLVSSFNISQEKITPIIAHGGFDDDEVLKYLTNKQGHKRKVKTVLCVSKITTTKNQLAVIKAAKKILTDEPQAKFIFAGAILEEKYLASLKQYISENNLSESVELKGEVTRGELSDLYSESTIFVFPSLFESQGTVIVEAMTFGLPVIASNIEPVTDVANMSPGTIIQVDMSDTAQLAKEIVGLLRDDVKRESMSEKSKALARRFSWENMASQTSDLYKLLLERRNRVHR